ncbi:MAG: hypothetical protein RI909_510 [Bacteroidota bacterium]|jgi:hypothetical protein
MDEKISLKAVDHYAQQYALHLVNSFFEKKSKISGPEILQLSEIKQVNLFVVRDLLSAWKKESEKLKSPFFDYEAPAVNEALITFQNTLSNHILISRQNFLPLLTKAVSQTIYLILDPYDFYSDALDKKEGGSILTADLKNDVKYIKINKAPLENLVAKLEEKKMESISGNEAFAALDRILEEVNFTPEEIEPYLQKLHQVVPLKTENFYEVKQILIPQPPVSKPEISTPIAVQKTVAANVPKESRLTLADDLAKKKIIRLKDNLTINQKFMFTKILFHGDFEIFSEAIDRLDRFDNLAQAIRFIDDAYPDWDREGEEFLEFMEIVEKRFND